MDVYMADDGKTNRVLKIYTMLMEGRTLNKGNLANEFQVAERTIQRDIDDIRNFFDGEMEQSGYRNQLLYDRIQKGYRLERIYKMKLTNPEILATCKVLLDSRCLTKKEMENIIDKLIECCVPEENQTLVKELVSNEKFHYIEPVHKTVFIDKLWQIGEA
ncbi:MAG: HTH domain-containing protein, partial [Eubacteriales bacterium]